MECYRLSVLDLAVELQTEFVRLGSGVLQTEFVRLGSGVLKTEFF